MVLTLLVSGKLPNLSVYLFTFRAHNLNEEKESHFYLVANLKKTTMSKQKVSPKSIVGEVNFSYHTFKKI